MWVTLDFEASGLTDASYPIEVGYSLPDGTSVSLLINLIPLPKIGNTGMITPKLKSTVSAEKR